MHTRHGSRLLGALAVAAPLAAHAQAAVTVTGRVTGEAGQPLPGASVFVPALSVGTTTRPDGTFLLNVPAARATGQTVSLTARLVGYRAQTVPLALTGGPHAQNFTLAAAATQLSAVVVTGAGTVSTRERLGTTINSVDSSTLRRQSQPQNVVSALSGTAPNVVVRTESGEPGASAFVQIRGASSVTGTSQPLFVVDGQPIDNSTVATTNMLGGTVSQNRAADINPNDVESVEILKGSAAAAIYGARASNGVVLVTTKRGRAGQTRYTLSSLASFDDVTRTVPLQRAYGQGSGGAAAACHGADCAVTSLSWGPLLSGAATFDHSDEIFKTGTTLDNNLTVSGGNDRTTFFLSGGLTGQDGVIVGPNNRYNRTSVRLKATQQVSSAVQVTGNFDYVDGRGRYVQKGSNTSGLLLGALRTSPDFDNNPYLDPTTGLQRSYRFPRPSSASLTLGRGYDNPFFVAANPANRSELGRFLGSVAVDWHPLGWLRVQEQFGADNYADQRVEALPLTSSGNPVGQVTRLDQTSLELDNNLLATAERAFSPRFTGRLTVGQNLNSRRFRNVSATGQNLIAAEPFVLQNTISVSPPVEFRSLRHIEAYFGQAEADLYDQLYLTAGVRNDGFSTFGASNRRANYPKASVAWAFTRALGNTDQRGWLSQGKLRAAYGETGREPPVYGTITAYSVTSQFGSGFGDVLNTSQGGQGGVISGTTLGNANLKPERDREAEVGADFGFLDQRADVGVTYFDKHSTDVIVFVPANAGQTGYLNQLRNGASIRNRGVELTANVRAIQKASYGLTLGLNFGRIRGRVESLAGAEFIPYPTEGFAGSAGSSTVGYAPGVLRGSDFARCGRGLQIPQSNGTSLDIDAACAATAGGFKPGALYLAADGQPIYDATDRVIADPNPRWNAGLNAELRVLKKLRLSTLLDVRRGGQVWDGTRGALYRFGTHEDTEVRARTDGQFGVNFLTGVYPDVAGPGAGKVAFKGLADWQNWFTTKGGSASLAQAQFVERGSFAKLRELSASYTFDQPVVRRTLGFSSVDLRLAGRNLHTWTKYRGLDPESNLGGAGSLTQGIDFFTSPQTRSFVVGATFNR